MSESTLPVVDVDVFRSGGADIDRQVCIIDRACRELGFFAVTGHGVDEHLTTLVYEQAERFFTMPDADKVAIAVDRSTNHTGYVGFTGEQLRADLMPDAKEVLEIALEPATRQPPGSSVATVSQMPDLDHFEATIIAYQRAALDAAAMVLRGLALALDLRAGFFERRMRQPLCSLHLVHHPPVPEDPTMPDARVRPDVAGCGAHTDVGLITLSSVDDLSGSEMQRRDGTWLAVEVPEGAMIVNLGDMLARWTNDRYVSTRHRVTSLVGRDRYSLPFFVNPDADAMVEPMPSCVSVANPARHAPIRAGEYLASTFDDDRTHRTSIA